ncbi:MAG: N-acetyltransferase [Spirochaetales bacterium]|nr:N-acetyltransferase [Spirochaetales bacterium]
MPVSIKRAASKQDLKKFITFPSSLYKDTPYWVPPLISSELATLSKSKNPAFEHCEAEYWLAYRDSVPVGRIAGIINHKANEKWNTQLARFSWVDFIDDSEVTEALFNQVETWAKEKHMLGIHGPLGFTNLDKEGMLIEGFDEPGTLPMIYNYPYYPKRVTELGYTKDADWIEFEIRTPQEMPKKIQRVTDLVLKRTDCRLLDIHDTKKIADTYGHAIFRLMERAYQGLYGTVPLSDKQIDAYIQQYVNILDPRFTKLLVDAKGRLTAFGIAMPSLTEALRKAKGHLFPFGWIHIKRALKHPKKIDLYLVAVDPDYQNRGLNAVIMSEITRNAMENGVEAAESSGELEDNTKVQQLWRNYDTRQHKRRRSFIKLF